MKIPSDFETILKSLSLTGVIFCKTRLAKKANTKLCEGVKSVLKSLVEITFVAITVTTVYSTIISGAVYERTFKVTTIVINVLLLILRISLLQKKTVILKVLSKLYTFGIEKRNRFSLRKYAVWTCVLLYLILVTLITYCTFLLVCDYDKYAPYMFLGFKTFSCDMKFLCAILVGTLITMYGIHFIMFPGLVMVFLSFMYLHFAKAFQRHLDEMRIILLKNSSKEQIFRSLMVFKIAREIHQEIEKAVSFISFLACILTFGNIIQVVSSFVTGLATHAGVVQTVYSFATFICSVLWFIVLAMCATEIEKSTVFMKNMIQDVVTMQLGRNLERYSELEFMKLFHVCSDIDFRFTAWGMFAVDKKLILTFTSILVTYGALFETLSDKIV
ncbi:uncharacterized protein TNCT_673261 [Trichonephila clavata]|uniref:Uncharacterized protein n=1 Tax=Trichonephila clavata TaxID=2740835 RepID=A0A8X6J8A9_TRICU|nr:uncharacterized protein TNCT_673261 [Trichonephila clavata]